MRCWSLVDRAVIASLRERGWAVVSVDLIQSRARMKFKARKGKWQVFAPDSAKLWDITSELDAAPTYGRREHRKYLAPQGAS